MTSEFDSAFEGDSEVERKKRRRKDLAVLTCSSASASRPAPEIRPSRSTLFDTAHRQTVGGVYRFHDLSLSAYDRHRLLVNNYLLSRPGARLPQRDTSNDRTDLDLIRENHKFVWNATDEQDTWEKKLAKRYYDKLFKEYCLCDLTYYKLNKVALRWRVEKEVISGKGQFECGNKKCTEKEKLRSWEVNFAYTEGSERKNCLVKLRLCPGCSRKLNYRHRRKEVTKSKKRKRERSKSNSPQPSVAADTDTVCTQPKENPRKESIEENIWKQPVQTTTEKSIDEQFDDFLSDLFV